MLCNRAILTTNLNRLIRVIKITLITILGNHLLNIHHTRTKVITTIIALLKVLVQNYWLSTMMLKKTILQGCSKLWKTKNYVRDFFLIFHSIASYLKSLLTDKNYNTENLINTITELFKRQVDSRQLSLLKIGFVKHDKENKGILRSDKFRIVFNTIMKQSHSDD